MLLSIMVAVAIAGCEEAPAPRQDSDGDAKKNANTNRVTVDPHGQSSVMRIAALKESTVIASAGPWLAVVEVEGQVNVIRRRRAHDDWIRSMAVFPSREVVATATSEGDCHLWSFGLDPIRVLETPPSSYVIAGDSQRDILAVASTDRIALYSIPDGTPVGTIEVEHEGYGIESLCFDEKRGHLIVLLDDGLQMWESQGGRWVRAAHAPDDLSRYNEVRVANDGETPYGIITSYSGMRIVRLQALGFGETVHVLDSHQAVNQYGVAIDQGRLAYGSRLVEKWNIASGEKMAVLDGLPAIVYSLVIDSRGRLIAGLPGGRVSVLDGTPAREEGDSQEE